jgi:hypothetical protein
MMTRQASGEFEVKMLPQAPEANVGDPSVGRMSLDKQFSGGLTATSKGQMLTMMTDVPDSAGYVAIERVIGILDGHEGSFALQHHGIMTRGAQQLSIMIVPDSGTSALKGISGAMTIEIADGKHSYTLNYTLPTS